MLALVMAMLTTMISSPELFAQQAPPQYGQPQQDYSGQIQSDENGYPQQPYQNVQANQQQGYLDAYPQQAGAPVQPLGPDRLEQLVAPIALYPDTLVGLVLTASTYPAQVQDADRWVHAQGNLPPDQIAAGANAQIWDPSVKALAAIPEVLEQMDRNLAWTTDLGNAYYNQPSDVLQAVQVMRRRAQSAGTLQPTTYEAVNYVGGNIQLLPPNPQVIYVPAYNPWIVYGQPFAPYPGFSLVATLGSIGSLIGSFAIHWGPGIAMTAFTTMPWGLLAWGVSWLLQAVLFHNSAYCSRSTTVADWGFPHGGPRAPYFAQASAYRGFGGRYSGPSGMSYVHRPPTSYRYSGTAYNNRAPASVRRPMENGLASVHRPPSSHGRPASGYNTAQTRSGYASRSNGYSEYRPAQSSNRGYQGFGYAGAPQRTSAYSNAGRGGLNDRAMSARLERPSFGQRSYSEGSRGFGGSSMKQSRSSFGSFGGGHSQSFKAPKMKAPKMSSPKGFGGHSGGGGHGGGHSGGKHH